MFYCIHSRAMGMLHLLGGKVALGMLHLLPGEVLFRRLYVLGMSYIFV